MTLKEMSTGQDKISTRQKELKTKLSAMRPGHTEFEVNIMDKLDKQLKVIITAVE